MNVPVRATNCMFFFMQIQAPVFGTQYPTQDQTKAVRGGGYCVYLTTHLYIPIRRRDIQIVSFC